MKLVTQRDSILGHACHHLATLSFKVCALVAHSGTKRSRFFVACRDLPVEVQVRREHVLVLNLG